MFLVADLLEVAVLTDVISPEVRSLLLVFIPGCAVLVPIQLDSLILLVVLSCAHLSHEHSQHAVLQTPQAQQPDAAEKLMLTVKQSLKAVLLTLLMNKARPLGVHRQHVHRK